MEFHSHDFSGPTQRAERATRIVVAITAVMMVVEILAGWWSNSMALLADGWHMSSHTLAIGLSALAYAAARRFRDDPRFAFGTWKIEVLAGYTSALLLLVIAAGMVVGSVQRLLQPLPIRYDEAIPVATVGLVVNIACAWVLLRSGAQGQDAGHGHAHGHGHGSTHHSHGHDLNLRAAYLHVLADALTSVLAIVALAGGAWYGWGFLDPMMGIVGAVLVGLWAKGLLQDSGRVLLDSEMDHPVVPEIRAALEGAPGEAPCVVRDLHVWRVGQARYACVAVVEDASATLDALALQRRIAVHEEVVHSTIEVRAPVAGATRPA